MILIALAFTIILTASIINPIPVLAFNKHGPTPIPGNLFPHPGSLHTSPTPIPGNIFPHPGSLHTSPTPIPGNLFPHPGALHNNQTSKHANEKLHSLQALPPA